MATCRKPQARTAVVVLSGLSSPAIWETLASSDQAEIALTGGVEANEADDAVAVEWDQLRSTGLAPGARQAFTVLARTQVPSPLGIQQVAQAHTVGQTATVSVTATDTAGIPYAGRRVVYSIGEANPKLGSVSTDAGGVATISYVGTVAGVDTMHLYLDLPGTGVQTRQDPAASAQIAWSQAPPVPDSGYSIASIRSSPTGTITLVLIPRQDGTATAAATVPTASISRAAAVAGEAVPAARSGSTGVPSVDDGLRACHGEREGGRAPAAHPGLLQRVAQGARAAQGDPTRGRGQLPIEPWRKLDGAATSPRGHGHEKAPAPVVPTPI